MNGHIRKRKIKNGYNYQVNIELEPDPFTGERKRICKTVPTKKEAEKLRAKMLNELNTNTFIGESDIVLKTYMEDWLETYVVPNTSPLTHVNYRMQIKNHIYPTLGGFKLQSIKSSDIQKLYNTLFTASPLSGKPLAPKTIKNIHMNLHACLDRAVKDDIIRKNPSDDVILPKQKRYSGEVYDKDETRQLLEIAKDTDMELVVSILVGLGLRRGELLALEWSDINFDKGTLTVSKSAIFVNGERIVKEPKTVSGNRTLTVPKILLELLNKWHAIYLMNRVRCGADFQNNNLIICKEDGSPYHPDTITQKFEKLLKRNGLRHIRLHDLRHINATMMLGMDISPKVAQKRLGHSNYNITMDIYSHVLEDMEQDAADRIDNELNNLLAFSNV